VVYDLKIIKKILNSVKSRCQAAKAAFDIRDFFVFCGLVLLGHGLYLLRPWVSFSVCGTILMMFGFLMGGKK
jgi:hypothetical protein